MYPVIEIFIQVTSLILGMRKLQYLIKCIMIVGMASFLKL